MKLFKNIRAWIKRRNINSWALFFIFIYIIFTIKVVSLQQLDTNLIFATYSILVSLYILSRFALAYLYIPEHAEFDSLYQPTVSFAVPSKNEGDHIYETIIRIAKSKYPSHKFNIIAVNDGSTDNTHSEMLRARTDTLAGCGVDVVVVDWKINRGKREGMAECVRRSKNDIMVFIDSDSFVEPATVQELVKYFSHDRVGAVAGHTYVANADDNMLTRMQSVKYFVAFKAYKSAESLFGSVTCCSGCCSAYRRDYIAPLLDEWLTQKFLGVICTYGDDRSLTNMLLKRGYIAAFSPTAIAYTFVPDSLKVYMKQQLRWKKSWFRENLKTSLFMWKRNPIMSLSFYMGFLLPLFAPIVVLRAMFWFPVMRQRLPIEYLFGLVVIAIVYGLYYYVYVKDRKWIYGALYSAFYSLILIWQLPYAILTIRDSRWGTRV